jgi:riboflavin synthase
VSSALNCIPTILRRAILFTGLIEATGEIVGVEERIGARRVAVLAPGISQRLRTGDSVAVSGTCLTALNISTDRPIFQADLAAETVARTSLAALEPGTVVNLELPTRAGTPLGGHIVQGHVDATGTMLELEPVDPNVDPSATDWRLRVAVPESVVRYVVEKGSIAIEGISLTVAKFDGKTVTVAVIPHTWAHTNLHTLKNGDPMNLEADVMLKFFAQPQKKIERESDLHLSYLIANGY